MPMSRRALPRTGSARGLSLVELMIGITIGLIVVAGATLLTATQLGENRRLLLETQVQQDLRAAADIVTRELRRGGYVVNAESLMWSPALAASQPAPNLWSGLEFNVGGDRVRYEYWRPGVTSNSFGYRLTNGGIQQRIGIEVQDLTDRGTLKVTAFAVTPFATATRQLACPNLCADGTQNCWPTLSLDDVEVSITGQPNSGNAVNDAALSRTVTSRVRLRNEAVRFNVSPAEVCP